MKTTGFWAYLTIICIVIFAYISFGANPVIVSPKTKIDTVYINHTTIDVSPPMPSEVNFAGEKVPLQMEDIKERFERELLQNMHWHSVTSLVIKRSNRWKEKLTKILKEQNIPEDFYYLMICESAIRNATSPSGAKGYWQFIQSAAKEYGLEISSTVDERYHPIKSATAACKYLKDAYTKFGSWTSAAAAYNMGMGGLDANIKAQNEKDYYNLFLNQETSRYVFRILAIKYILQNPEQYGFRFNESDLYKTFPCKTLKVSANILDLVAFAKENNCNYKTLKIINPWLIDNKLIVKPGKTYEIIIPSAKDSESDVQMGFVE